MVHILLAQGREEHNWKKAQSNYAEVQHFIVRASDLEVYGDVERLLPDDIDPECVEMEMEIEEYVREERTSRKGSLATEGGKGKKRKRSVDPTRNMPAGAVSGFTSAKNLVVKSSAKRKKELAQMNLEHADEDDSDDVDIETGIYGARRTKSASAAAKPAKRKKPLARSATTAGTSKTKKRLKQTTLTQRMEITSQSDSEDEIIENGLSTAIQPAPGRAESSPEAFEYAAGFRSAKELPLRSRSPDPSKEASIIDISSSPDPPFSRSEQAMLSSSPDRPLKHRRLKRKTSSSPDRPLKETARTHSRRSQGTKLSQLSRSSETPERSASPASRSVSADKPAAGDDSMAWLIEDDDDDMPITTDQDRKSTRLNSSHSGESRMPSSA